MTSQLSQSEHVDLDSGTSIRRGDGDGPETYKVWNFRGRSNRMRSILLTDEEIREIAEQAGFTVSEP